MKMNGRKDRKGNKAKMVTNELIVKMFQAVFRAVLIAAVVIAVVVLGLTADVSAPYDAGTDYMAAMMAAAMCGNDAAGKLAEEARGAKIDALSLDFPKISYEDLKLLAKIIEAEAGSDWLPDEWKMAVGEVVLNRVASPEFPDTVKDVIYQPGQYSTPSCAAFASMKPSARSAAIAALLLHGERVLNDRRVVFQANFPQGGGTALSMYDANLGTTYFCYSSHMELYGYDGK